MWKNTTKQQITKKIACSEKITENRKENVKMSNNQEMSLQYTYILVSEGKHRGNSPRLARTQVGMVENVHSTRFKREFCKSATKSDSKTTPEKGLM